MVKIFIVFLLFLPTMCDVERALIWDLKWPFDFDNPQNLLDPMINLVEAFQLLYKVKLPFLGPLQVLFLVDEYYKYGANVYDTCKSTGGSSSDCIPFMAVCVFQRAVRNHTFFGQPPFSYITELLDIYCKKGEPSLKCCQTGTGDKQSCHTAFNTKAPINCEGGGGVGYAPPVKTAGLCLLPYDCESNSVFICGCCCQHLKDCKMPNTPCLYDSLSTPLSQSLSKQSSLTGTRAGFLQGLTNTLGNSIASSSKNNVPKNALIDFMTFRGAKEGWINYFKSTDTAKWSTGKEFDKDDIFAKLAKVSRHTQAMAMTRFVNAVPGFWKRFDFINFELWTQNDEQVYMNKNGMTIAKAEEILRSYMSPFLFDIFKKVFPNDWYLYAIQTKNETKNDWSLSNAKRYIDGVELGSPTEASLEFKDMNGYVDAVLSIINKPKWLIARIDWGDMTLDDPVSIDAATKSFKHTFKYPGKYLVKVFIVNNYGLRTYIRKAIDVKTGYQTNIPDELPVSIIRVKLAVTVQGVNEPSGYGAGTIVLAVEAAANNSGPFMLMDYASLPTEKNVTSQSPFSKTFKSYVLDLLWSPVTPISAFKMTCRQIDHSEEKGYVLIDSISFYYFDSFKLASNKTSYNPDRNSITLSSQHFNMKIIKGPIPTDLKDPYGRWILPCARRFEFFHDSTYHNPEETVALFTLLLEYTIFKTGPLYEYDTKNLHEVYIETSPGKYEEYNQKNHQISRHSGASRFIFIFMVLNAILNITK